MRTTTRWATEIPGGATGKVASTASVQVPRQGMPLYTCAGGSDPGDVTDEGVDGIGWVVSPAGTTVTRTPAPESPGDPRCSGGC